MDGKIAIYGPDGWPALIDEEWAKTEGIQDCDQFPFKDDYQAILILHHWFEMKVQELVLYAFGEPK